MSFSLFLAILLQISEIANCAANCAANCDLAVQAMPI